MKQLFVALAMAAGLWHGGAAQAWSYTVTDLGTLGGTDSRGIDINASGQITGWSYVSGTVAHAFLYSDGVMHDLGTLGGLASSGHSINDAGQVTGRSWISTTYEHAFIYSDGTMVDLGTTNLDGWSVGMGINNSGQVTGSQGNHSTSQAFLYSAGVMSNISPGGGSNGISINNAGQVTGYTQWDGGQLRAFLYTGDTTVWLGTLGGTHSAGWDINNLGHVTGTAWTAGNAAQRAFLWSNGAMHDLGSLGGSLSNGLGIDDLGRVVGSSKLADDLTTHAFLYDANGMRDLNSLIDTESGWTLLEASAINTSGQITGWGMIGGETHAFLLSPVPEPKTYAMIPVGLALVGFIARRRKNAGV